MTYPTYDPVPGPPPLPQDPYKYRPAYAQQPHRPLPVNPHQSTAPSYPPPYFRPDPSVAWGPPASAKPTALPWLIGGLVAILIAGGIGLLFLLNDEDTELVADPPIQSDPGNGDGDGPVSDSRPVPSPPTDCLVECTDADAPGGSDTPDTEEANYAGSSEAAVGFVEAIANGDVVDAHESLCGAGKIRFATPEELVADFYATLGFSTITGARLTDVYAADASADAVVFELETEAGEVVAEVYIVEEGSSLTVCGYDVP